MNRTEGENRINACIRSGNIDGLSQLLTGLLAEDWFDNDLRLLFDLTFLHREQVSKGQQGIFHRAGSLEEILSVQKELRRKLRKAEWQEEFPIQLLRAFADEKRISEAELEWTAHACCVNSEKVLGRFYGRG